MTKEEFIKVLAQVNTLLEPMTEPERVHVAVDILMGHSERMGVTLERSLTGILQASQKVLASRGGE